ncbi:YdiU family protein [Leucobacter sp. gxy201]|uniref:protein adenylyltransferase SelO n=1 Tax=Leucobacter sp. gxy201 TaxID=2957200 RepID=UPI003DA1260A
MNAEPAPLPRLTSEFAHELPELSLPWSAAEFPDPKLLVLNEPLARELGLDPVLLRCEAGTASLLGARLAPGSEPVAQAYAGHQFGSYAPRLGDGRALLLGEIVDAGNRRRDLHLKGSGRTPFSRGADGFAAVGPMLREYLMGEAMHALGIPTTRALAVLGTGARVMRDESLDPLPGAVLVRTASSHLRVGSFQYARSLEKSDVLPRLVDFAIDRHCPEAAGAPQPALRLLRHVVEAQARLVAQWMLVGFVHGVMNTDNMTISGETIDYGPCAFIDAYDPAAAFSSIDWRGRYAYGKQPAIALWNLTRFAETLLVELADDGDTAIELAVGELDRFDALYAAAWGLGMAAKLGVAHAGPAVSAELHEIAAGLLAELQQHRIDYTNAFRALAGAARGDEGALLALYPGEAAPGEWYGRWRALRPDGDAMDAVNPLYIPRGRVVDDALGAATEGDLGPFEQLLDAVMRPYEARPGYERFAEPAPAGAPRFVTYCGT